MIENVAYWWMLSGIEFEPDNVEKLTGLPFESKSKRGGRVNQFTSRVYKTGSAILSAAEGFTYWPLSPDDVLLNAIEVHYDTLRKSGVEELVMYYTIGYQAQCNLEFSPEQLQRLTNIGATLAISCVELNEDE